MICALPITPLPHYVWTRRDRRLIRMRLAHPTLIAAARSRRHAFRPASTRTTTNAATETPSTAPMMMENGSAGALAKPHRLLAPGRSHAWRITDCSVQQPNEPADECGHGDRHQRPHFGFVAPFTTVRLCVGKRRSALRTNSHRLRHSTRVPDGGLPGHKGRRKGDRLRF